MLSTKLLTLAVNGTCHGALGWVADGGMGNPVLAGHLDSLR